jgi:hypothetical protein
VSVLSSEGRSSEVGIVVVDSSSTETGVATGSGVAVVAVESSIFTELPDVELSAKEFSESNVISRISVNFIFSSFQSEIRAWIMI